MPYNAYGRWNGRLSHGALDRVEEKKISTFETQCRGIASPIRRDRGHDLAMVFLARRPMWRHKRMARSIF